MAAKKPTAKPSVSKQSSAAAKFKKKTNASLSRWGTLKDAGEYLPKSTKKAAVDAIKKSKVKVTTKQKQAVRGGKTTTGRMGTEGKNTRGEAKPRTGGYSPDYGRE